MVDQHRYSIVPLQDPRARQRWGSLANEKSFLDLLEIDTLRLQQQPQPAFTLAPINANIYARRHSAHTCPTTEERPQPIPPPVPLRPPAVPKRTPPPTAAPSAPPPPCPLTSPKPPTTKTSSIPPPIPPIPRNRTLPPIPPPETKPRPPPPARHINTSIPPETPKRMEKKPPQNTATAFEFGPAIHEYNRMPAPPPPVPKTPQKSPISPAAKNSPNSTCNSKMSVRQDSGVSSDSFSQTSSPSYTTKTMETPLLPPRTPNHLKHNGICRTPLAIEDDGSNSPITKSVSTPASLQTIVRFHNGSNMSLHHKVIIRDFRRPSSHYRRRNQHIKYVQLVINAIALFAITIGVIYYMKVTNSDFSDYPPNIQIITNVNQTPSNFTYIYADSRLNSNPAPGVCLPVIVQFCQQHRIPYNYTVFPNYMGHFGQRDAQLELEVYDAVVDVRCYELAALFLCSVFVPKCGSEGDVVRPCRSLCHETKRRCGFFLDVFGLALPDYLECNLFPESANIDECVGHQEVRDYKLKSQKPVCPTGFQCDVKRCIPQDWRCDGHLDCKDQSDELNCKMCPKGQIHCGNNNCITQNHMCDGKVDCAWAQDERNCLRLSDRNGDEGRGQLQVYKPDENAWAPACVKDWDQPNLPHTICSLLGYSRVNESKTIPPVDEATKWKTHQRRTSKNMLKEFGSCTAPYPTVNISCTNYICGKRRKTYAEQRHKRIVGGVISKPGNWPFLAALLGGPEEIFYCAGVLISDQWVLTASHCVGNHSDVSGWTIQLGITRRHSHAYYGQKMKVKRVIPHPMYNLGVAHDNDVALFQLSSRVTFHEHLLPVCLPPTNKELPEGRKCTVIGWGKKEDTGMSEYEPQVNEVDVPILNRDLCNKWLHSRDLNVTDGMICAGYSEGGKDACQGDSGGPLLCYDNEEPDRWFVGGIVSWGIKCAHPTLPGVYAYVPKYIPWIKQQMQLYSD